MIPMLSQFWQTVLVTDKTLSFWHLALVAQNQCSPGTLSMAMTSRGSIVTDRSNVSRFRGDSVCRFLWIKLSWIADRKQTLQKLSPVEKAHYTIARYMCLTSSINYSQQIDIDRRLERIECIITNYLSTVDAFTVAQRAAAILTTANPIYALVVFSGNISSVVQSWY